MAQKPKARTISSLMVEKLERNFFLSLAIPLQDTRLWMVKGRFLVHITNPEKKDKLEEWAKVRKMRQMDQRSC